MKKFGNIRWLCNIAAPPVIEMELTKTYNPQDYPVYESYAAIEVSRKLNIPIDYYGLMGVPITFIDSFNQDEYELIGLLKHGKDGEWDFAVPILNGKEMYTRFIIRRKLPKIS